MTDSVGFDSTILVEMQSGTFNLSLLVSNLPWSSNIAIENPAFVDDLSAQVILQLWIPGH